MEENKKHGQGARHAAEKRRAELEQVLAHIGTSAPSTRRDIESALRALRDLMTGDLDNIPPAVTVRIAAWLESSKYLGIRELREIEAASPKKP
jgi:hypothetical protein